jgi:biopolymer transport protein ExbD
VAIKKPGQRLGNSVALKGAKLGMSKVKRPSNYAMNLTPMIDMFTILVVFLLMSYSASGELLFVNKDILLPKAFNAKPLERAPVIGVSKNVVLFEGDFVVLTKKVEAEQATGGLIEIPELKLQLEKAKASFVRDNPGKTFTGEVIILADEGVPYNIIEGVMYTCKQTNYTNMMFAVQKEGAK